MNSRKTPSTTVTERWMPLGTDKSSPGQDLSACAVDIIKHSYSNVVVKKKKYLKTGPNFKNERSLRNQRGSKVTGSP